MSSATSTDRSTFRPWHFFVLSALLAATAAVLLSREASPAQIILLSAAVFAGGLSGLAFHRTIWPLVTDRPPGEAAAGRLTGRARHALEREKRLVLRSIKELEFDRAMGKIAPADFEEMSGRLRVRALALMKQLDETPSYRELIEREVARRLAQTGGRSPAVPLSAPIGVPRTTAPEAGPASRPCPACGTANDADGRFCKSCGTALAAEHACAGCGTINDEDARFCKGCGVRLNAVEPS